MNIRSQKEKAESLLSLHASGDLMVLPNVWNPIGALILEKNKVANVPLTTEDYSCFRDMMSRAEVGEYLLTGNE